MKFGQSKYYLEVWWKGIKSLPDTTSLHGFKFITDTKKHLIERICWLILVALSWYGSSLLIAAQYDAFENNPISFVVETTYKEWNTIFPSVAVCESENMAAVEEASDRVWGPEHDFNIEEVIKELSYYKGVSYYGTEYCGRENPIPECFNSNLTFYANLIRSRCDEILENCTWNGISFDCCKYFRPMDTELGVCYAINSLQGRESNPPKLEMVSNRTSGPGILRFQVLVSTKVYILNEEDVPALTALGTDVLTVGPELVFRRNFAIRNIENDAAARLISPAKRKCRYTDENILEVHRYYSYSACTVQCRKEAQMRLCNCTNFYMPNVPEHIKCNMTGVICLNKYVQTWSAPWSPREGLFCDCLPSCTEAEITVIKDFQDYTQANGIVQIELNALPTERYRRNVVRGILDLVGGTAGLFLGASILSFVELLYILLIRPFCDIYSQREDDPWHRKYGTRSLADNKVVRKNFKKTNIT